MDTDKTEPAKEHPTKSHTRKSLDQLHQKLVTGDYKKDELPDLRREYQQRLEDWERESPLKERKAAPLPDLPKKYKWEAPPQGFVPITHLLLRSLERTGSLEVKIISYLIEHTLAWKLTRKYWQVYPLNISGLARRWETTTRGIHKALNRLRAQHIIYKDRQGRWGLVLEYEAWRNKTEGKGTAAKDKNPNVGTSVPRGGN